MIQSLAYATPFLKYFAYVNHINFFIKERSKVKHGVENNDDETKRSYMLFQCRVIYNGGYAANKAKEKVTGIDARQKISDCFDIAITL